MDRRRAAGALLALAACIACSAAAPTASNQTALDLYEGAPEGCYYNFQHYGEGDRIMTNEPCLNCTCHNRMLMCYLRVCPFTKAIGQDCTVEKRADQCCPIVTCPDVPVDLLTSTSTTSPAEYGATGLGKPDKYGCTINGKYLSEGSKVPPTPNKPCEHCYCIRNMTTCVMQECTLHVDGCTPIYHKDVCCPVRYSCDHPEDEVPLLDDMSTTVRPTPGFLLTTTTVAPVTQMTQDCVHDDQIFADGALIKTEKACEHCYCMKGDIVCVVQECGAPMENEGKNCTSLPPREGQCCPDTYICEGDEVSSDLPTEPTTETLIEKLTTLSPPRRAGVEGSGYRNEPDETYTEIPTIGSELEGSGEEQETSKPLQPEESPATDEEDVDQYISVTTKAPSFEHQQTTTEMNKDISSESHEYIPTTNTPVDEVEKLTTNGETEEEHLEPHEHVPTNAPEGYEQATTESSESLNTVPDDLPEEEIAHEYVPSTTSVPTLEESGSSSPVEGQKDDKLSENVQDITTSPVSVSSKDEYSTPSLTSEDIEKPTATSDEVPNITPEVTEKEYVETDSGITGTTSATATRESESTVPQDGVQENESYKPELIAPTTASSPVDEDGKLTTEPDHAQNTVATAEEESTEPHLYIPTATIGLPSVDEEKTTVPNLEQNIVTDKVITDDVHIPYDDSTTAAPILIDNVYTTTEPDKGLNTIPSEINEESSSEASLPEITTLIVETKATESSIPAEEMQTQDVDIKPTTVSETVTSLPENIVTKGEQYTITTEPSFRKEDESSISTEKQKEIEPTTVKAEFVDEDLIPTSPLDERYGTSPDVPSIEEELTTSVPEYTKDTEQTIESKQTTTESILETSVMTESLPGKVPEASSEKESELPSSTETIFDITSPVPGDNEIHEAPSRIPGEGDCLLNGVTYKNNTVVPSTNNCHTGCRCASSIIKCDPIICSPPPDYMDNCQSIYDSPDSCCPTYVCDHPRETVPPQSDNQMSGTESPMGTPTIECRGDQCEITVPSQPPVGPSDTCISGNCAAEAAQKPEIECGPEGCGDDLHKPDIPSNLPSEECTDGKCKPESCANGECQLPQTQDQASPVTPCEGEHCEKVDGVTVSPQLCQNEDCKTQEIPVNQATPCEGESCKKIDCGDSGCDSNVIPSPQDGQSCNEEGGCKPHDVTVHDCTGDEPCRRKEVSTSDEKPLSECEGSNCKHETETTNAQDFVHLSTEEPTSEVTSAIDVTEKIAATEDERETKIPEDDISKPEDMATVSIMDTDSYTTEGQTDTKISEEDGHKPAVINEENKEKPAVVLEEGTEKPALTEQAGTETPDHIGEHDTDKLVVIDEEGKDKPIIVESEKTEEPVTVVAESTDKPILQEQTGVEKPDDDKEEGTKIPSVFEERDTENPAYISEIETEKPAVVRDEAEEKPAVTEEKVTAKPEVTGEKDTEQPTMIDEELKEKPDFTEVTDTEKPALIEREGTELPVITQEEGTEKPDMIGEDIIKEQGTEQPSLIDEEGKEKPAIIDDQDKEIPAIIDEEDKEKPDVSEDVQTVKPTVIESEGTEQPTIQEEGTEKPAKIGEDEEKKPDVIKEQGTEHPTLVDEEGKVTPAVVEEEGTEKPEIGSTEIPSGIDEEGALKPIEVEDENKDKPTIIAEEGTEKPAEEEAHKEQPAIIDQEGTEKPTVVEEDGTTEQALVEEEGTEKPAIIDEDGKEKPVIIDEEHPLESEEQHKKKPEVIGEDGNEKPAQVDEGDKEQPATEVEGTVKPATIIDADKDKPSVIDEGATVKPIVIEREGTDPAITGDETYTEKPTQIEEEDKDKLDIDNEQDTEKPAVIKEDDIKESVVTVKPAVDEESTEEPEKIGEEIIKEPASEKPTTLEMESTDKPAAVEEQSTEKPSIIDEEPIIIPSTVDMETSEKPDVTETESTNKPVVIKEEGTEKPDTFNEEGTKKPTTFEMEGSEKPDVIEKESTDKPAFIEEEATKIPHIDEDVEKEKPDFTKEEEGTDISTATDEEGTEKPALVEEDGKLTIDQEDVKKPDEEEDTEKPVEIQEEGKDKPAIIDEDITEKPIMAEKEDTKQPETDEEEGSGTEIPEIYTTKPGKEVTENLEQPTEATITELEKVTKIPIHESQTTPVEDIHAYSTQSNAEEPMDVSTSHEETVPSEKPETKVTEQQDSDITVPAISEDSSTPKIATELLTDQEITTKTPLSPTISEETLIAVPEKGKEPITISTVTEQIPQGTSPKLDTIDIEEGSTLGHDMNVDEAAFTTKMPELHETPEFVEKVTKPTDVEFITEPEEIFTDSPELESTTKAPEVVTVKIEPQDGMEPEKPEAPAATTSKVEDESTTKTYEEDKIKPVSQSHVTEDTNTQTIMPVHDGTTTLPEHSDTPDRVSEIPVITDKPDSSEPHDTEPDKIATQLPVDDNEEEIRPDQPEVIKADKEETITETPAYSVTEPVRRFTEIEDSFVTGLEEVGTQYPEEATEHHLPSATDKIDENIDTSTASPEKPIDVETPVHVPESEKPVDETQEQTTQMPEAEKDKSHASESPVTEIPISVVTDSHVTDKDITSFDEKITSAPDLSEDIHKATVLPEDHTEDQESDTVTPQYHVTVTEEKPKATESIKEQYTTNVPDTSTKSEESEATEKQTITTEVPRTSVRDGEAETKIPELMYTETYDQGMKEQSVTEIQKPATELPTPSEDVRTEHPDVHVTSEIPQSLVTEHQDIQTTVSSIPKGEAPHEPELLTTQFQESTKVPDLNVPGQEEILTETPAHITTESIESGPHETEQEDKITKVPEESVTEKQDSLTTLRETPNLIEEIPEATTVKQIVDISQSTEHTSVQAEFSQTTEDLVELELHTHKNIEDFTTVSPIEEDHTYKTVEDISTSLPSEGSDKIEDTLSTASPSDEERTTAHPSVEQEPQVSELTTKKATDEEFETATKEAEVTSRPSEESSPEDVSEKVPDSSVPIEDTTPAADHKDYSTSAPTQISVESTPTVTLDKKPISESDIAVPTEKETSGTEKPLHPIVPHEPAVPEEEFTTKATTVRQEEEILTSVSDDKYAKPEEKPNETSEVPPASTTTEVQKPGVSEMQPTDEIPAPDEDGHFPPSGTGGYGEPDYVEEDQAFGPGTCRYGGKVYVSAQQIPRDDPCDFCFCFRSDIICLQQSCPPPIHGCHEEPIQGFCCPRYECPVSMATTVNVTTTTTTTTTTLPPHFPTHSYKGAAQRRGCQIKGHTYKVGEVVRSSSGPCLHCTCGGDGQMKCDPKACTPEPMLRQMIAAAVSAKRRR